VTETAADSIPSTSLGRLAGRAGWAIGDQALSSLMNFGMGVIVARALDPSGFGAFTVAFSTFLIVLNVARAISTQPLAIRYSAVPTTEWRTAVASASGTLLASGLIAGLPLVLIGLLLGPPLGPALVALGVVLPALLVQDGWRSALFAAGRGGAAFAIDLILLATLLPLVTLATSPALPQPAAAILAWGMATAPATVVGIRLTGARPAPFRLFAWLRRHRDLSWRYAVETAIGLVAAQAGTYAVGAFAGLAGAGALRGASLVLGPSYLLILGAYLVAVPEGVRIRAARPDRFVLAMVVLSLSLAAATLGWLAVMLLLPVSLGHELLGPSWESSHGLLAITGMAITAAALTAGPLVGLRVLADAASSLKVRFIDSPVALILGVTGAILAGAPGAALGYMVSSFFSLVLFAVAFARSLARHEAEAKAKAEAAASHQPVRARAPDVSSS
jgi:O-antigen/teichoic acid export membrane protein